MELYDSVGRCVNITKVVLPDNEDTYQLTSANCLVNVDVCNKTADISGEIPDFFGETLDFCGKTPYISSEIPGVSSKTPDNSGQKSHVAYTIFAVAFVGYFVA